MSQEPRRAQAYRQGQSICLDNLSRRPLASGQREPLRDRATTGITSYPTIFQKAISGSPVYDQAIQRLGRAGQRPDQIIWNLMIEDVVAAADVLRPAYEATEGEDGFVSRVDAKVDRLID